MIDGEYRLKEVPSVEEHVCWVSGNPQLVKSAISQMLQAIERDPTRSINQIYEDVRLGFTRSMGMSERQSFLQEFPTFKAVQSQLFKKRREIIPRNPATMKELEIDLPWFLTDQQEYLVKGDQVFDDGRRVILFTTNDHLEILAKAPQILGDGTFRITPTQWYQVFIISAQVSPGVFVPVCFALLPDKKRESYNLQFSQFIQAILGLGYIPLERLREGLRNLFIFNRGNLAQSLAQCLRGSRGQANRGRARGRGRGRARGRGRGQGIGQIDGRNSEIIPSER